MTNEQYLEDLEDLIAEDAPVVEPRTASILTVERAAYVAIGLLAAVMRFYQLGLRPLSESEAVQALAAFRFTQGAAHAGTAAPGGTIPALFSGNVVGFSLFGASDITARLLPALAGLILVLLPYWLRHRLGRGGALAASLLLAISPAAVYASRNLDSAILVVTCGLALAVALIHYLDTRRPISLYLAAVALGLGLCSGPGIFTLLLIFAAFGLLLFLGEQLQDREAGWSALIVAWTAARGEKDLLAKSGVVLAATFGLGATALVLHPAGLGHAADQITAWAKSFLPEPSGQPFVYPMMLLVRYEALILLLGLVESGRALLSRRKNPWWVAQPDSVFPHTVFLIFWALAAALIVLISGHRPPGNILLVVVPLALLAGQGVERAWRWITARNLWPGTALFAAIALGLLVFFYLWLTMYSQSSPTTSAVIGDIVLYTTQTYLILASAALALLVVLGVIFWIWRGPACVVAGSWLTATIALGLFGFQAAWGVGATHASDARELMILQTTVPDVRKLVAASEALSLDKAGDAHTLAITVDAEAGPVVAWYLREFGNQTVVEGLSTPPDTVAAITLAAEDLPIGETFRGQGFPLRTHWLPWGRWGQPLIRWLLFTEGDLPIVDQEVVLWVQSSK
jgi:uncharacterized protein (TIGR03663 family)